MKYVKSFLLIAAVALLSACAMTKQTDVVSGIVSEGTVTATATVKALDLNTRQVVLQRDDGSEIQFRVSDNVRNLSQVRVGDKVKVAYYESIAYEVKKPGDGTPGADVAEELARAKLGEKPGGAGIRVLTITATIAAIDKPKMSVTLRGPGGDIVTVRARDPKKLDRVAVGDLVEITYTEGLVIAVETPK